MPSRCRWSGKSLGASVLMPKAFTASVSTPLPAKISQKIPWTLSDGHRARLLRELTLGVHVGLSGSAAGPPSAAPLEHPHAIGFPAPLPAFLFFLVLVFFWPPFPPLPLSPLPPPLLPPFP